MARHDEVANSSAASSSTPAAPTTESDPASITAAGSAWLLSAAAQARHYSCGSGLTDVLDAQSQMDSKLAIPPIDCSTVASTSTAAVENGRQAGGRSAGGVQSAIHSIEKASQPSYEPNLRGHRADGWVMAMCAKCIGRPETMIKSCRRATSLRECQRHEGAHNQAVCNLCSIVARAPTAS